MFGCTLLPGYTVSDSYKVPEGSIWRSHSTDTYFRVGQVAGETETASTIPIGTIMKEGTDGKWTVFALADIISDAANLPGARIGVVSDKTAKTGYTYTPEGSSEPVTVANSVLIGIVGKVDQDRLLVGSTAWGDLTEEQQIQLRVQLEAWNISPVWVMQHDA